jgi:hypothetical protein
MSKLAHFDGNGLPIGFYSLDINGPLNIDGVRNPKIPTGVVEISDEVWLEFINNSGRRRWNGKKIEVYVPPEVVRIPDPISRRQFFEALANLGYITEDEAFAALSGTIPEAFQPLIESLPADQRFSARMLLAGATSFERNHPVVQAIGASPEWGAQKVDALWLAASRL